MGLLVPGHSSRGVRDPCLLLVSKQRDYKTTAPKAPKQSARSPSPTNALAPRSPGADESLLESALHLPERLTNQEIIRSGCAPRPGHSKDQRRRGSTPDGSGKTTVRPPNPRPQGRGTALLDGAKIILASSSWTCCQTPFENSGAKGAKARIFVAGRVRARSPLLTAR